jgi:hypothetical protein
MAVGLACQAVRLLLLLLLLPAVSTLGYCPDQD